MSIPAKKITTDSELSSSVPLADPGVDSVYRFLMYGLSLPERTVRSTAAMVGGAIHESATLLVPQAFRDSRTYNTFVKQMLDLMANEVGGVKPVNSDTIPPQMNSKPESKPSLAENQTVESADVEQYVAQKTVSTFIDLAGMATLHVSPLTILAIVSDLAYGSKTYLHELSVELKRAGVIADDSTINNTADLLDAIGNASSGAANAFDAPPLSVDGLRETIEQTRDQVTKIDPKKLIPQSEIKKMWTDMQAMADRENVSVFEVSSAMTMYALDHVNTVSKGALTTIRVTGDLLDRHLLDHYWQALTQINEQGIYTMVSESSRPYIDAVYYNFSSDRPTFTEDLISGKTIGQVWSVLRSSIAPRRAADEEGLTRSDRATDDGL